MAKKQPVMRVISESGVTERTESFLPETAAPPTLAKPDVADLDQGASALEFEAAAIVVADAATQARATEMLAGVKDAAKQVEDRRDSLVRPLNSHVKFINGLFRPITDKLDRVSSLLRSKLLGYHQEQERKARAERERAEAERAKAEAERKRAEAEKAKAEAARAKAALDAEFAATPLEQQLVESIVAAASKNAAAADAKLAESKEAIAAASTALVAAAPPPRTISGGGRQAQVKKRWTFRIVDQAKVPREFMRVDETAIRAAIHAGRREIDGVEIFQEDSLAVG